MPKHYPWLWLCGQISNYLLIAGITEIFVQLLLGQTEMILIEIIKVPEYPDLDVNNFSIKFAASFWTCWWSTCCPAWCWLPWSYSATPPWSISPPTHRSAPSQTSPQSWSSVSQSLPHSWLLGITTSPYCSRWDTITSWPGSGNKSCLPRSPHL